MGEFVNGWKKKSDKVGSYYECPACGFRIGKDPELFNHCPGCGADLHFISHKRDKKNIRKEFLVWISVNDRLPEATIKYEDPEGDYFMSEPVVVTFYGEDGELHLNVAEYFTAEEGCGWLETGSADPLEVTHWMELKPAQKESDCHLAGAPRNDGAEGGNG